MNSPHAARITNPRPGLRHAVSRDDGAHARTAMTWRNTRSSATPTQWTVGDHLPPFLPLPLPLPTSRDHALLFVNDQKLELFSQLHVESTSLRQPLCNIMNFSVVEWRQKCRSWKLCSNTHVRYRKLLTAKRLLHLMMPGVPKVIRTCDNKVCRSLLTAFHVTSVMRQWN